jgi:hypothetical protein
MADDKYPDIRERKKRVQQVKRELKDYMTTIQVHEGKLKGGENDRLKCDEKQYYEKIVECVNQFWGSGWVLAEKIDLPEEERRVREVVRPTLTTALEVCTAIGGWVHQLWFMFPKAIEKIDEYVTKWFGEQTADEALRANCLYGLYEIYEYQHPDAYVLAGLPALKDACYRIYVGVSVAHMYNAKKHLEWMLELMWELQASREEFEAAVAEAAATSGTSVAAAEIGGLLDAVLSDIDKLVNILEQARNARIRAREARSKQGSYT